MSRTIRYHLALDGLSLDASQELLNQVGADLYSAKVHDLYDAVGPGCIPALKGAGVDKVWVDFKLKDIPRTMEKRAKALVANGADILTMHGDSEIEGIDAVLQSGARVYVVSQLTSLEEVQIQLLTGQSAAAAVLYRARLAKLAGAHGIVASALEAKMLSGRVELQGLDIVVPGTRLILTEGSDQKRSALTSDAVSWGATELVLGSDVTGNPDPVAAFAKCKAAAEQYL